jgi:hypothetical protein
MMPFLYSSDQEIRKGNHVLLHGEPGVIQFVADAANNPEWYVKEHGGGVMILEPKVFGRLLVSDTANYGTWSSCQGRRGEHEEVCRTRPGPGRSNRAWRFHVRRQGHNEMSPPPTIHVSVAGPAVHEAGGA